MAEAVLRAGLPLREPLDYREMLSNVQGHYENTEARLMNSALMAHFKIGVNHPALLPFLIEPNIKRWVEDHPKPFIVKEPNLCFTWPVWVRSTDRPIKILWCRRDLEQQAGSLTTWYDIEPEQAPWTVKFYEMTCQAAFDYADSKHQARLDDPERIDKALTWLQSEGFQPAEQPHNSTYVPVWA